MKRRTFSLYLPPKEEIPVRRCAENDHRRREAGHQADSPLGERRHGPIRGLIERAR